MSKGLRMTNKGIAGIGALYYDKECFVCGKQFFMSDKWVYRMTGLKGENLCMCSWKCFREAEKIIEEKRIHKSGPGRGRKKKALAG